MRPGPTAHLAAAAAIVALFAATLAGLQSIGTAARRYGEAVPIGARPLPVRVVRSSGELYRAWDTAGARGRVVVHLSRHLHFVPLAGNDAADGLDRFPIRTFDLPRWYASRLDVSNVLWVALQAGIVRRVHHILPPADLAARLAELQPPPPGVRVLAGTIRTFENGSPRLVADRLPELDESVLLAIDASYLALEPAAAVLQRLQASRLESDSIVLSRAEDDPDVDAAARRRLDALAAALTEGRR